MAYEPDALATKSSFHALEVLDGVGTLREVLGEQGLQVLFGEEMPPLPHRNGRAGFALLRHRILLP